MSRLAKIGTREQRKKVAELAHELRSISTPFLTRKEKARAIKGHMRSYKRSVGMEVKDASKDTAITNQCR